MYDILNPKLKHYNFSLGLHWLPAGCPE